MKPLAAILLTGIAFAQTPDDGRRQFDSRCASCHGGDGAGGEHGPAVAFRLAPRTHEQLATVLRGGLPNLGMPAFNLADQEMKELLGLIGTPRPRRRPGPVPL